MTKRTPRWLLVLAAAGFFFSGGQGVFAAPAGEEAAPLRRYVRPGGSGAGQDWERAMPCISAVLDALPSAAVAEIWVAAGTYQLGGPLNIPAGVSVYGGFQGNEVRRDQRAARAQRVLLVGNGSNRVANNHGHLEGVAMTNGRRMAGGGLENFGTVVDCELFGNHAAFGGGAANQGVMRRCRVYDNYAQSGGGLYNEPGGVIEDCLVYENRALIGGGVYNEENAVLLGGRVYHNHAGTAGGVLNGRGVVYDVAVLANQAERMAGGIDNWGLVLHATLLANQAPYAGGIYNREAVINSIAWGHRRGDISGRMEGVTHTFFKERPQAGDPVGREPGFKDVAGEDPAVWDVGLAEASPARGAGRVPELTLPAGIALPAMPGAAVDIGILPQGREHPL